MALSLALPRAIAAAANCQAWAQSMSAAMQSTINLTSSSRRQAAQLLQAAAQALHAS